MKDVIIFGGSTFLNEIDVKQIDFNRFDTIAINRPVHNIPIHYLIAHDVGFRACHTQEEVKQIKQQGLNPVFIAPKTKFIHETTGWKNKIDIINHNKNEKWLGFCLYTCSSALNFAYLLGYKNVYFIGVDLEENNKPFTHWHGITNTVPVPDVCAKKAKEYLYQYKKYLNIYQVNPKVKDEWNCDFCPIEKLYH